MVENNITLYRGDSFTTSIFINDGDNLCYSRHQLTVGEKLYIGIREPNTLFEDSIVKKVYNYQSEMTDDGDIIFNLYPEDTEYLRPGTYYLCAKLYIPTGSNNDTTNAHDTVKTIIPDKLFYIL